MGLTRDGRSTDENVKLVCFNNARHPRIVSVAWVRIHTTIHNGAESYESRHRLVDAADRGSERNDNGFLRNSISRARDVI